MQPLKIGVEPEKKPLSVLLLLDSSGKKNRQQPQSLVFYRAIPRLEPLVVTPPEVMEFAPDPGLSNQTFGGNHTDHQ